MAPVSLTTAWATVILAGLLGTAHQAPPLTNAATQINAGARADALPFRVPVGSTVLARIRYPADYSATVPLQLVLRGKTGGNEYEKLENVQGWDATVIPIDPTNDQVSADGLWKYSYAKISQQAWDRLGCSDLIFGIVVGMTGTSSGAGGGTAACSVEAKCV